MEHTLRIAVYDKDKLKKDDYMGEVLISLASLEDQSKIDRWFPLRKSKKHEKDVVSGDIHISVRVVYRRYSFYNYKKLTPF